MKNYVVGLHGLPRVGKNTLADMLVARDGFAAVGFSEKLYKEVSEAFNVFASQLMLDKWKKEPQSDLAIMRCSNAEFCQLMAQNNHNPREPRTSRWILQQWGTEYRRAQNSNYWIEPVDDFIATRPNQPIAIYDVRFDNEAQMGWPHVLRDMRAGHLIIEITKRNIPQSNGHASNNRISDYLITHIVANDGTPDEMYQSVKKILESPWSY